MLGGEWTTDEGKRFTFAEVQGRPFLITFFFASCSLKCPITVDALRQLEASVPSKDRSQVTWVLVTMDPSHDDEAVLRSFRKTHKLARPQWVLLRGGQADTADLASALSFRFRSNGAGSFAHDSRVTLVGPDGRVAWFGDGLYGGMSSARPVLARLLQPL